MKRHFFITGYPRSRTCWTANLLSNGDSFCWHDGLVDLERLEDIQKKMEQPEVSVVGLSDPAILLFWKTLRLWYPSAQWIVIQRNLEAAYASSMQAFGPVRHDFFYTMEHSLTELMMELRPLVVPFEITVKVAKQIGRYLGVDVGPVERVQQLCGTNVQVHDVRTRMAHCKPPQFLLALS